MENKKIKIAVLMGGPSAEHNVSLKSGKAVVKNLNKTKYEVLPIKISRDNRWIFPKNEVFDEKTAIKKLKEQKVEIIFPALHGEYGEDGTIQEVLKSAALPYIGSGPLASALGINKAATAKILSFYKIEIPPFFLTNFFERIEETRKKIIEKEIMYPLVVKPANRGSSVGVSIVQKENQLKKAIIKAKKYSNLIMIQKFIKGREITCGILEKNGKIIALPPTEIIPQKSKFFDYKAKYSSGGSLEITPAKLPKKLTKKIQKMAIRVHQIIGCLDFSRTDLICTKDNKLYFLEINTLPGLTEVSLIPQQAKAIGISFPQFLDIIIQNAIKRYFNAQNKSCNF